MTDLPTEPWLNDIRRGDVQSNAIVRLRDTKIDISGVLSWTRSSVLNAELKLHDVRILMSVVQAGSMHKAAQRLATSQPAVSRAIGDLEHALGVRLLDRSPHGVEPTQYGRAIIKRGIAVFDELRQGVKDIELLADPTAGELRIGCTEAMAAGPAFAIIDRLTLPLSAHCVQRHDGNGAGTLSLLGGAKGRPCDLADH